MGLVLPPDLDLAWVSPAWREAGVTLMFQRVSRVPPFEVRQRMLRLTSALDDPEHAAEDISEQLLSTFPDEWTRRFGWHPA
jgi:hypothetical protein